MIFYRTMQVLTLLTAAVWSARPQSTQADDSAFEKSVAPILAARCVSCHNPTDPKGGLSLTTRQTALGDASDSGQVIVPGKPDESTLLYYITGDEPEMPKQDEPLSKAEVATIRKWIAAGAPWPESVVLKVEDTWWSRQPLARPAVPTLPEEFRPWVRTPIDAFVMARLQEEGMRPSEEADRRTLIRRLTYDLIGLPPTPAEVEAFVNSDDPQAYDKLVERLLVSPHYGERWARHWLDVVKYADTCGYDKDKLRPNAWPYRDYVIRSLNEDKPYTRFVQEQIAGDVLFPGQADGIVGLGFIAAGPWDFIGHVEVPESKIDGKIARNLDRDEMVTNTLNTFCSITIQCARCHNHKFDPYTQEHYYSLQSVFAAVDRADRPYDTSPEVERRRTDLAQQRDALQKQLAALDAEIKAAGGEELKTAEARVTELAKNTKLVKQAEHGYHSAIEAKPDQAKWVQVDLGEEVDLRQVVLHPCHDDFAGIGSGFGFPVRFRVETATDMEFTDAVLLADETKSDFANPGIAAYTIEKSVRARYVRVTATRLAERSSDYIFALAELEVLDANGGNVAQHATVSALDSVEAANRWRRTNLVDGLWPRGADPQASAALAAARKELAALQAKVATPERRAKRAKIETELAAARAELSKLPRPSMVYAAATEFTPRGGFRPTGGKPRPIHVLNRGNVQDPGKAVQPGTVPLPNRPDFEFDLADNHIEGERRAALARWITDKSHPLTWRSIVNRVWLYHFDQAIVGSPNDFGRMGQRPTHPELLDWLAVEFRDGRQSLKDLHRLIVRSSVYRQASTANAEYAKRDGGNQYLWRMNRRRLDAEEIRDAILAVSGRLNPAMGGPGFYLFELEKTAHSPHFEYHKFDPNDPKSHRRSVYRFIARSQPDPFMTTLDCADSSQSTPVRNETLTALQALSLLNNDFTLAMAEHFAQRLEKEHEELDEQIGRAMRLIAGREPTPDERRQFAEYARQHGLPNLCRVLFNLSEFVYLD